MEINCTFIVHFQHCHDTLKYLQIATLSPIHTHIYAPISGCCQSKCCQPHWEQFCFSVLPKDTTTNYAKVWFQPPTFCWLDNLPYLPSQFWSHVRQHFIMCPSRTSAAMIRLEHKWKKSHTSLQLEIKMNWTPATRTKFHVVMLFKALYFFFHLFLIWNMPQHVASLASFVKQHNCVQLSGN